MNLRRDTLVIVLAVAAAIPLLLGFMPRLPLPGPVVEIAAGVLIGPSVLAWVRPDETIRALSVLGLSFLLFLAGFEVDVRRFRGRTGAQVLVALIGSLLLATAVGSAFAASGMRGGLLVGIALLATSLGLIVPVLADAGVLHAPVGVLTVACASAGEVAAVVALSLGGAGSNMPLPGRVLLLGLLVTLLGAIAAVVVGAEHVGRITALVDRLADTSTQIRVRLTVLLVAGIALAAASLGFEAILGAFMAGVLVRTLDPQPELAHPRYPVKLEAILRPADPGLFRHQRDDARHHGPYRDPVGAGRGAARGGRPPPRQRAARGGIPAGAAARSVGGRITATGDIAAVLVDRLPDRHRDGTARAHDGRRTGRGRGRLGTELPPARLTATGIPFPKHRLAGSPNGRQRPAELSSATHHGRPARH